MADRTATGWIRFGGKGVWTLMACTAALASAQTIYRVVGPDGKVTYTDRPPSAEALQRPSSSAATAPAKSPLPAPVPGPTTPPPSASASVAAKKAEARKAAEPAADTAAAPKSSPAAPPPFDPALERAVVGALGYEGLVKKTEDLCIRTLPTSMKRYGDAAQGWHQRNAPWLGKARMAMAAMGPGVQQAVQAKVDAYNTAQLKPVNDAAMAQRIKWCDQSAHEISSGIVDLGNKPAISGPLAKAAGS